MKQKFQIISLLASRRPANDHEKVCILTFCESKNYSNVYFKGSSLPGYEKLEPISMDQFLVWFRAKQFEIGDVVSENHNIFLVTDYVDGQTVSKAHIDSSDNFSTEPVIVAKNGKNHHVSANDRLRLQRALAKANLEWNPLKKVINPKTTPATNPFISLWQVDHKVGLGIFREVDPKGNITLYCYLDEQNRHFEYKPFYSPGSVTDYTVKIATNAEKSLIVEELNGVNLRWQGKLKRFEPIDLRKGPGKKYYYMSSCGRIKLATEEGRDVDDRRFKIGNYFHSAEEAERFKRHMVLERNNHMVGTLNLD